MPSDEFDWDNGWDAVVQHPRYGNRPIRAPGWPKIPLRVVAESFWRYRHPFPDGILVDGTAIRARGKQKQGYEGRPYYVDILKVCRNCDRHFLFFAQEQKYWYEDLQIHVDADCVLCPECRQEIHYLKSRFQNYSELMAKGEWTDAELETLVSNAVFLFGEGMLQKEEKLRRLRNLANKRIPITQATAEINALIAKLGQSERSNPQA